MPNKKCRNPGCTKYAQVGGVCRRHGAKVKLCSREGCTNQAQKGGVCIRHGAKVKQCNKEGCTNIAVKGGVCVRHGAKVKLCSREGCTNQAQNGGVCMRHGAKVKLCSREGCTNIAVKGGVCKRHGAKVKQCSREGCTNQAQKGGLCRRHGTKVKLCSREECTKYAQKGGLCRSHGAICSHNGCTNQVQRSGLCRRHGAYKRPSPNEINQEGVGSVPPLPATEQLRSEAHERREEEAPGQLAASRRASDAEDDLGTINYSGTGGDLVEDLEERGMDSSQLPSGMGGEEENQEGVGTFPPLPSLPAIERRSEAPEPREEEASEQLAASRRASDAEDDLGAINYSGTGGDLFEDLEERGMDSSQLPSGMREEEEKDTDSNLSKEPAAFSTGVHADRLQNGPAGGEIGEALPTLREANDTVGAECDEQSEVCVRDEHVDNVRYLDRRKRSIDGKNEFPSTKRQCTQTEKLDSHIEISNLKATIADLKMKLGSAENVNAKLEEKINALEDSLDRATKSQSDDDECLICCREHKVTCPRCSFSMCRNCLVMQYLSTRHEYDTEAGYGVFEQDPTKCPGCKLDNAFVLEDEEQVVVDRANQRSGGHRARGQRSGGDRERADEDETVADYSDDSAPSDPSADCDSSSDYEPSEEGSASR